MTPLEEVRNEILKMQQRLEGADVSSAAWSFLAELQKKENILLQAAVVGQSGRGSLSEDGELRTILDSVLEDFETKQASKRAAAAKTKGFSEVSMAEVSCLLNDLCIVEVDGNVVYPIEVPDEDQHVQCGEFNFNQQDATTGQKLYPDEDAGTPDCLRHHQQQLEKFSVTFGTDGYSMYDLHRQTTLYSIQAPRGQRYRGGVDGCVAPCGLTPASASQACRIMYEHKVPAVLNEARSRGQVEIAMLGAYAYNQYPLMADRTDGKVHNLYEMQGDELVIWSNLEPQVAYWKQARLLADPLLAKRTLRLESIPEDLQAPVKKLRNGLRGDGSGLREQLDSVVPFLPPEERIGASMEMILAWQQACQPSQPSMSKDAQSMYV